MLVPSPVIEELGDPLSGQGCVRAIPPLYIREEILESDGESSIVYRVVNPGWMRFYPVKEDSHRGRIELVDDGKDGVDIDWTVRWDSLYGGEAAARMLTKVVVSSLIENLAKALSNRV